MLIKDLPNAEYHADKFAISSTSLSHMFPPAKYLAFTKGWLDKEETDALQFGQAYHTLILEPEKFEQEFAFIPDVNLSTTKGKELKAQAEADHPGAVIFKEPVRVKLERMRDTLFSHDMAKEYLQKGHVEHSIFWEQELQQHYPLKDMTCCNHCWHRFETDVVEALAGMLTCPECEKEFIPKSILCKTRPDFYTPEYVIDLKTADEAYPFSFYWKVKKGYNYKRQAALQLLGLQNEGFNIKEYYWVVQEKTTPYLVSMVKLGEDLLDEGLREVDNILTQLRECRDLDVWPGYPGIIELTNPENYSEISESE